jgi:hypothetical protein
MSKKFIGGFFVQASEATFGRSGTFYRLLLRGDTFGRDFQVKSNNSNSRDFQFGKHFIKVSPLMQKLPKEKYAFFLKHQSLPVSRHLFADSSAEVTPFADPFIPKAITLLVGPLNLADTSKRCHLLRRN